MVDKPFLLFCFTDSNSIQNIVSKNNNLSFWNLVFISVLPLG